MASYIRFIYSTKTFLSLKATKEFFPQFTKINPLPQTPVQDC